MTLAPDWLIWPQTTRIWSWTLLSLSIFGTTESKSHASNLDDYVPTWSLKDHVGTLGLRTISVRSKSKCIKKSIKHLLFCAYIPLPSQKTWNCKKIHFFANDIMLGQLPFKWLLETGEAKTCKLDQYAYRSCWDISLRDFNQK